jgi:muramoyltetrapeptide carboxypeptidase
LKHCEWLFGEKTLYCCSFGKKKTGKASGELVGGNLSILYSLFGSHQQLTVLIKLFIEDLDEYLYHIDDDELETQWMFGKY